MKRKMKSKKTYPNLPALPALPAPSMVLGQKQRFWCVKAKTFARTLRVLPAPFYREVRGGAGRCGELPAPTFKSCFFERCGQCGQIRILFFEIEKKRKKKNNYSRAC